MKQFYIASNINLHAIFYSIPLFFSFFLAWMVEITFRLALLIALLLKEEVYVCYLFGTIPESFAYHGDGYSFFFGGGGPTVACHVGGERHTQAQHLG